MAKRDTCSCDAAPKLVFPCSGAADVGELADHAARKLTRDGTCRMYCLAGIGGRVDGILETTRAAAGIIAIDGCATRCASKTLEQAGFTEFEHVQLADLGLKKGESPLTDESVVIVAQKARQLLAEELAT